MPSTFPHYLSPESGSLHLQKLLTRTILGLTESLYLEAK